MQPDGRRPRFVPVDPYPGRLAVGEQAHTIKACLPATFDNPAESSFLVA
jgi:hypothetical protein